MKYVYRGGTGCEHRLIITDRPALLSSDCLIAGRCEARVCCFVGGGGVR